MHPKRLALLTCLPLLAALLFGGGPAAAQVRIKDIADLEGVRDNQLVGYGLVVGLNGTGDKLDNDPSPANPWSACWSASASTRATRSPPWRPRTSPR